MMKGKFRCPKCKKVATDPVTRKCPACDDGLLVSASPPSKQKGKQSNNAAMKVLIVAIVAVVAAVIALGRLRVAKNRVANPSSAVSGPQSSTHLQAAFNLPDQGWRHLERGDVRLVTSVEQFSPELPLPKLYKDDNGYGEMTTRWSVYYRGEATDTATAWLAVGLVDPPLRVSSYLLGMIRENAPPFIEAMMKPVSTHLSVSTLELSDCQRIGVHHNQDTVHCKALVSTPSVDGIPGHVFTWATKERTAAVLIFGEDEGDELFATVDALAFSLAAEAVPHT